MFIFHFQSDTEVVTIILGAHIETLASVNISCAAVLNVCEAFMF